jgi:hypothetical protein
MPQSASLTGSAGVYFVASRLNATGYHVGITLGSVPTVDLLVSSQNGKSSVCLQVKTSASAMRTRGRGDDKAPHHYEWDIGWGCAHLNRPDLFFALVDLREYEGLPEVFILLSRIICLYFKGGNPEDWPRARYHPLISEIAPYRENWKLLQKRLGR